MLITALIQTVINTEHTGTAALIQSSLRAFF
jgi:hypothetical protein